eukprot:TRINITY_DN8160_c0_g1_i1.p1 TRINITY_DN8160_c0_g1~~TRINITY_DN8160_c0_g1_i1.p1  ORF type:complete len:279 (-),score=105.88 TRINITY_DN8160_c0_g1_i1:152-988(-)
MNPNTTTLTNVSFDLGCLLVSNARPLTVPEDNESREEFLRKEAIANVNLLLAKLYDMKERRDAEREAKDEELQIHDFERSAFEVDLPEHTTIFPRHKKIPPPKKLTKWERFAKEKGIMKRKRSRLVWDKTTKDWAPRWGYRSAKHNEEKATAVIEAKPGDDPNADPFEKRRLEKKLQKEKQNLNQMRNIKAARKGQQNDSQLPPAKSALEKRKHAKESGAKLLRVAQLSTASMGKFDNKAHKEEPKVRKKKKTQIGHITDTSSEKRRNLEILERIGAK